MKGSLVLAHFERTPWALLPDSYHVYRAILHRWAANGPVSNDVRERIAADREAREARRGAAVSAGNGAGIAVLPLYGVITQRGNMMDDLSGPGSVSTQMFSAALDDALADETVGQILIDIDSPGGSVYGIQELADEIFQARGQKPVIAIANSLAASAAFWLGSQASEFYVTPGGEVGSIGVIMAHVDYSVANEKDGVKVTYITAPAGGYKAEGNSNEPLSADAKAFEQGRVDDYYGAFTRAVARGRAVPIADVRDGMGKGRVFGADQALAAKMVDGVKTFDAVVKGMRATMKQQRASAGAVSVAAPVVDDDEGLIDGTKGGAAEKDGWVDGGGNGTATEPTKIEAPEQPAEVAAQVAHLKRRTQIASLD